MGVSGVNLLSQLGGMASSWWNRINNNEEDEEQRSWDQYNKPDPTVQERPSVATGASKPLYSYLQPSPSGSTPSDFSYGPEPKPSRYRQTETIPSFSSIQARPSIVKETQVAEQPETPEWWSEPTLDMPGYQELTGRDDDVTPEPKKKESQTPWWQNALFAADKLQERSQVQEYWSQAPRMSPEEDFQFGDWYRQTNPNVAASKDYLSETQDWLGVEASDSPWTQTFSSLSEGKFGEAGKYAVSGAMDTLNRLDDLRLLLYNTPTDEVTRAFRREIDESINSVIPFYPVTDVVPSQPGTMVPLIADWSAKGAAANRVSPFNFSETGPWATGWSDAISEVSSYFSQTQAQMEADMRAIAEARKADPKMSIAYQYLASGNVGEALSGLAHQPENIANYERLAEEAIQQGDAYHARLYHNKAQTLKGKTPHQIFEEQVNPWAEIIAGVFLDPLNLVDAPLAALFGPEARALRRQTRMFQEGDVREGIRILGKGLTGEAKSKPATYNYLQDAADKFAPLLDTLRTGDAEILLETLQTAPKKYKSFIQTLQVDPNAVTNVLSTLRADPTAAKALKVFDAKKAENVVDARLLDASEFWTNLMPFARTRASSALKEAEVLFSTAIPILARTSDGQQIRTGKQIVDRIHQWAQFTDDLLNELGPGLIANKQVSEAMKTLRLVEPDVKYMKSLQESLLRGGEVNRREFMSEFMELLYSGSKRLYGGGEEYAVTKGFKKVTGLSAVKQLMSQQWLVFRPGNWVRNALGAAGMAEAVDGASLRSAQYWDDYLQRFGGGNWRLFEASTGASLSPAATEAGATGLRGMAGKVTETVAKIPYGRSEVGPIAIGEQAWYTRIYGKVFERVLRRDFADTVKKTLGAELLNMGVDKGTAQRLLNRFVQAGVSEGQSPMLFMRNILSEGLHTFSRTDLGFPDEMLSMGLSEDIENIVSSYTRAASEGVGADINDLVASVRDRFDEERAWLGKAMYDNPPLDQYLWLESMKREGDAYVATVMNRLDGAGITPQQKDAMRTQAAGTIAYYQNARNAAFERIADDLQNSPATLSTLNVVYDFFSDMLGVTAEGREFRNQIMEQYFAKQVDWPDTVSQLDQSFRSLSQRYGAVRDQYRQTLLEVQGGTPYTTQQRWGDMLNRWMEASSMQELRAGVKAGDYIPASDLDALRIGQEAMRAAVDKSFMQLLDVFRRNPSVQNFDLLHTAFRNIDQMGVTTMWLSQQVKQGKNQAARIAARHNVPDTDKLWEEFGKAVRVKNWAYGQQMVATALRDKMKESLQFVDQFGETWRLFRPLGNQLWEVHEVLPPGVQAAPRRVLFQEPGASALQQGVHGVLNAGALDNYKAALNSLTQTPQFVTLPENLARELAQAAGAPGFNWYELFGFDNFNPNGNIGHQVLDHVMGNLKFSAGRGHYIDTVGMQSAGMLETLDSIERRVISRLEQLVPGMSNGLTPQQRLQLIDKAKELEPMFQRSVQTARNVAEQLGNFAMLDFSDKRNIDVWLSLISPFPYFWTRMLPRGGVVAASRPSIVNMLYEVDRNITRENKQAGLPRRTLGTVPNPLHMLGDATDNQFLQQFPERIANPVMYAFPFAAYLEPNPFIQIDRDATWAEKSWLALQKYGGLSFYPQWSLLSAMGAAYFNDDYEALHDWDMGDQVLFARALQYGIDPQYAGVPYINTDLGAEEAGEDDRWPATRKLWSETVGSLTRLGTRYDFGVANREIANMVANGEIDPNVTPNPNDTAGSIALFAMDVGQQIRDNLDPLPEEPEQARVIWEEAAERMGHNKLWAIAGSFFLGLGMYRWSDVEAEAARIASERRTFGFDEDMALLSDLPADDLRLGSQEAVDTYDELPSGVTTESGMELTQRDIAEPRWAYGKGYQYDIPYRFGQEAVREEVGTGKERIYDKYGQQEEELAAASDPKARVPWYYTEEGEQIRTEQDAEKDALMEDYPSFEKRESMDYETLREAASSVTTDDDLQAVFAATGLVDYHGNKNATELRTAAEENALRMVEEEMGPAPEDPLEKETYNRDKELRLQEALNDEVIMALLVGGRRVEGPFRSASDIIEQKYDKYAGPAELQYKAERKEYLGEQRDSMVERFGEAAVAEYEAAPSWNEDNPQPYYDYYDAHPEAELVRIWRNGRRQDERPEYYDDGKDFEEAIDLFGEGVWELYQTWDPEWSAAQKGAFYDEHPNFRGFWKWWNALKDGDTKAGIGSAGEHFGSAGDGEGRAWSDYWDEYRALPDAAAKADYLRNNPAFAAYYKEKYGTDWWTDYQASSRTYSSRGYSGGGGYSWGGGGGGRDREPPAQGPRYIQVQPESMSGFLMPTLDNIPRYMPWRLDTSWQEAGAALRPGSLRRWREL